VCGFSLTSLFHGASAGIGGLWSLISGIVVLQSTRRNTWSSACLRILGTLVGSIISAVYLSRLPFSAVGMAACIFATVLLCHTVRIPDHARLAAITVALIMVMSGIHPGLSPVLSAVLRFCESCIGTAIAVLGVLLWSDSDVALEA
jgi:uncharacterized membrane protein YccC